LKILAFIGLNGGSDLAAVAAHTGYPKSTLLRLIQTIIGAGFLQRTEHGRYRVTLQLWRIGAGALDYESVRERVVPVLRWLVEATSETAHYSVYDDGMAVYVEKIDGLHPVRAYTSVGGRSPAFASATGKALLAWQDEAELRRVAAAARSYTDRTLVGVEKILRHAEEVRRAGYAVNRGEWRADVWGVAAPIFGKTGKVEGAVGISGPVDRIKTALRPSIKAVMSAAQKLSAFHGSLDERQRGRDLH
jgi:DNA-binding IclR family transcriptional regulator